MMFDRDRMIYQLLQMLADLGWKAPPDVIDQMLGGALMTTAQAADACQVAQTTVQRWCNEDAENGRPLGILLPSGFLIGKARLLARVEAKKDRHERLIVKDRAEQYVEFWSRLQLETLERLGD
jgi:hypothetical protein